MHSKIHELLLTFKIEPHPLSPARQFLSSAGAKKERTGFSSHAVKLTILVMWKIWSPWSQKDSKAWGH